MKEIDLINRMREEGLSINAVETIEEKMLVFERALKIVIKPRDQSDRTSFHKIANWLRDECKKGNFSKDNIFRRVLDFALEASGPGSKNPAAVFTTILKKELGYKK